MLKPNDKSFVIRLLFQANPIPMNHNYITIDNTGIPILSQATSTLSFGNLINSSPKKEDIKELENVRLQAMYLPNFSVRVSEGKFDREAIFVNTGGVGLDLFGTCLLLKGNLTSGVSRHGKEITSFNHSQNFKYDPNNIFIHKAPANNPFHIVHFSVKPEHLLSLLPENEKWADELGEKISSKESVIGKRYAPITLLQERALQNVFDCPLQGHLGEMMIETSIVQIMLIQLHSVYQSDGIFTASVAKRDIDIIQSVREHLSHTFLEDHSLDNLARQFGVNTNKLMTLFKKIFSKSIFEYLSELRMDYARELLVEKDYLITEVARTLGYKNPNHFSAAFKKKFGFPPSQLR